MLATIGFYKSHIAKQTAKAVAFDFGFDDLVWMPKSQINIFKSTSNEYYVMAMPIWLAKQMGFWGYNQFGNAVTTALPEKDIFDYVYSGQYTQIHKGKNLDFQPLQ